MSLGKCNAENIVAHHQHMGVLPSSRISSLRHDIVRHQKAMPQRSSKVAHIFDIAVVACHQAGREDDARHYHRRDVNIASLAAGNHVAGRKRRVKLKYLAF